MAASPTGRGREAEYTSTVQADGVLSPEWPTWPRAGDRNPKAGHTTLAAHGAALTWMWAFAVMSGVLAEGDGTVIGVTLGAPHRGHDRHQSTTSTPWLRTRRPLAHGKIK